MKRSRFLTAAMGFGLAFLYLPIAVLVIYSFNAGRNVSVWEGFSVKWYGALFANTELLNAALLSIEIAAMAATVSLIIGTAGGLVLSRFGPFRGRALLGGLMSAPLVMPEVLIGLSLLLLFVAIEGMIGWPQRGILTVVIGHSTYCIAYLAVIVQSRLVSMDESIEEAAQDLGARPLTVFFRVTVPVIAPALISGWMLAFTLSFDDVVVASFTNGPGTTTLPVRIYSSMRLGIKPEINALASVIVLIVAAFAMIGGALMVRRERQRRRDEALALSGR